MPSYRASSIEWIAVRSLSSINTCLDNPPNNGGDHLGSSYQDGWWGYASKDLRRIMGMAEKGKFSRAYCGRGSEQRCRAALNLDASLQDGE